MDNQENSSTRALEYGGLGLFLLGAFPLVLVLTAFAKGQVPADQLDGLAGFALKIVDGFGYVPPLIVCGGFSVLGIWMFLGNRVSDLAQHMLGLLFVGFGAAVLLGAIDDLPGGAVGRRTGGFLRVEVHTLVGMVAGGLVIIAAIWGTWFRAAIRFSRKPVRSATISEALSEKGSDGVSTAEANALVPDERTLAYMEDLWREPRELRQPTPIPPSPYPDDVRVKGEIPEGAAPLTTDARAPEQRPDPAEASRWRPAKAEREAGDGAGADLAAGPSAAPGRTAAGADDPFSQPIADDVELARILAEAPGEVPVAEPPSKYADGVRPLTDGPSELFPAVTDAGDVQPPRPTWESENSFDDDVAELELLAGAEAADGEVDEEAIEAELDAIEQEEIAGLALGDLEVADEEEEGEEAAELDEEEEEEDEEAAELDEEEEEEDEEAAELDEGEEEYEEEDEEDEEAAELDEEEEDEDEDEEAAELDEEEEEYEEEDEEGEEAAELDEEEEDEEGEEAAELDEEEEEDEEDEEAAELDEEEEEDEEAEEAAELDEDEEEDEEEAAELDEEEEEEDAEAEVAESEDEEAAELEEEPDEETEPEVTLEPHPTPEGTLAPEHLLRECGNLFIQEGRVAVSLLQRRFALDFDEACEVLDELQEQGLIGPYMGGQRRDILLTLEEWQARAATS